MTFLLMLAKAIVRNPGGLQQPFSREQAAGAAQMFLDDMWGRRVPADEALEAEPRLLIIAPPGGGNLPKRQVRIPTSLAESEAASGR